MNICHFPWKCLSICCASTVSKVLQNHMRFGCHGGNGANRNNTQAHPHHALAIGGCRRLRNIRSPNTIQLVSESKGPESMLWRRHSCIHFSPNTDSKDPDREDVKKPHWSRLKARPTIIRVIFMPRSFRTDSRTDHHWSDLIIPPMYIYSLLRLSSAVQGGYQSCWDLSKFRPRMSWPHDRLAVPHEPHEGAVKGLRKPFGCCREVFQRNRRC